jgi:hypothetical protein
MARVRLTFRERDVTAAIRAVKRAGGTVARVEIRDGGVSIVLTEKPGLDADNTTIDEDQINAFVENKIR